MPTTQTTDEDALMDRAIAAHWRHARRNGLIPTQPARTRCSVTAGRIVLSTTYGVLAVYDLKNRRLSRREDAA